MSDAPHRMDVTEARTEQQAGANARNLLKKFYQLQAERVQTYEMFEEGFKAYLKGAPNYNFNIYRQLVHEITEAFQKISQDVIGVKNSLANECNLNQVANIIDQVQDEEKEKLELTANLQIARQNLVDHPSDESYTQEIRNLKQGLNERKEKINEYLEDMKYETEDLFADDDDS